MMKFFLSGYLWGGILLVLGLLAMWKPKTVQEIAGDLEGTPLKRPADFLVKFPFIVAGIGAGLVIPSFVWHHIIVMAVASALLFFGRNILVKKLPKKKEVETEEEAEAKAQ